MLSFFLELAGSLVAPDRCAACDAPVRMRAVFCPPCASSTLEASHEKGCLAAFLYGGAIARSIARFKYEGRSDLARPLSSLLLRTAPRLAALSPEIAIPVPMHPLRLEIGRAHV